MLGGRVSDNGEFGVVVSIVAKPTGARVDNGSMSGVQLEGMEMSFRDEE